MNDGPAVTDKLTVTNDHNDDICNTLNDVVIEDTIENTDATGDTIYGNGVHFKDQGILKTLKQLLIIENVCQRKNFVQTICVYYNLVLLGWTYGQLGTAFPDLQLILQTNVQQTSLMFTMNSIGYMAGNLLIGAIYDRVNKLLLLGVLSIINGVTSAVLPWCSQFGLFLFVRMVDGFLCGGRNAGGNARVASCWGAGVRQYMQALHFTYAIGGIISPLVTELFLAPRIHPNTSTIPPHMDSNKSNDISSPFVVNTTTSMLSDANTTLEPHGIDNDGFHASRYLEEEMIQYGETNVQIVFLITGILTAISGLFFVLLHVKGYEHTPPYAGVENKLDTEIKQPNTRVKSSKRERIVFIAVLGMSVLTYCSLECKYQSFIMPFVMLQLHWTKSRGAFLISLLWAFYGLGRFICIFISRCISPQNLLLSSVSMFILASCGMYLEAALDVRDVTWAMIAIVGLSLAGIFPTFILWTHENVLTVTGKLSGFFGFICSVGFLFDPLYIGVLMENVSPMYFIHMNVIAGIACFITLIGMFVWISTLRKRIQT